MADPPVLWGWTPVALPSVDGRWLAVKDAPAPRDPMFGAVDSDVRGLDFLINREVTYQAELLDNWSKPIATFEQRAGDCEDFALLKRAILLDQGIDESRIYFLFVLDTILRCDHAVLLVEDEGEWRILDCHRSLACAVTVDEVIDYTPLRAMQGDREWTYSRRDDV